MPFEDLEHAERVAVSRPLPYANRVVERDGGEAARVGRPRDVDDVARVTAQRRDTPPPLDIWCRTRAKGHGTEALARCREPPEHHEVIVGAGGEEAAIGRPPHAVHGTLVARERCESARDRRVVLGGLVDAWQQRPDLGLVVVSGGCEARAVGMHVD